MAEVEEHAEWQILLLFGEWARGDVENVDEESVLDRDLIDDTSRSSVAQQSLWWAWVEITSFSNESAPVRGCSCS